MRSTIDKAGRVVIPAALRARAGLSPGSAIDIRFEDGEIRLTRDVPGPKLVRVSGRWVARPTAAAGERRPVDVSKLIEEERDRWPS
jgi:AbrB family looped-hinge helix DNA binding protein